MSKITAQDFKRVKKMTWWKGARRTALAENLHLSTVLNIKSCRDYEEYEELKRAEHPPTVDSLKDRVLELHRMTFQKPGITYFEPRTARSAVVELQVKALRDKRGK